MTSPPGRFNERVYTTISPGWIYFDSRNNEGVVAELKRLCPGLESVEWQLVLTAANALEQRPSLYETFPLLQALSTSYREFRERVLALAISNTIIANLSDVDFARNYARLINQPLNQLNRIMLEYPDSLVMMKYIGVREYAWLDNSYLRFLAETLLPYNVDRRPTISRSGRTVTITYDTPNAGYSNILETLRILHGIGILPETIRPTATDGTFHVQATSSTRSRPGFYTLILDALYPLDNSFKCYYIAPSDSPRIAGESVTLTYDEWIAKQVTWNYNKILKLLNSPTEYRSRTRSLAQIYLPRSETDIRVASTPVTRFHNYYDMSNRGVRIPAEFLTALATQVGISVEFLEQISRDLAECPSHLNFENWEKVFNTLKPAFRRHSCLYEGLGVDRPGLLAQYNFIYGAFLLQPIAFGSFPVALFCLTHTYIPQKFLQNPDGSMKYSAIYRALCRVYVPVPGDMSLLPDFQSTKYYSYYLRYLTGKYSVPDIFREADYIYNPKTSVVEAIQSKSETQTGVWKIERLILGAINLDANLAAWLTLSEDGTIANNPQARARALRILGEIPDGYLAKTYGIWLPYADMPRYFAGERLPFLVPCTKRRCLNPETAIDLDDTTAVEVPPDPEISYEFFAGDTEYPLVAFGTKDRYVCASLTELRDKLDEALAGENPATQNRWMVPSSLRVTDAAGTSYPNPYAEGESLEIRPNDIPILRTFFNIIKDEDTLRKIRRLLKRQRESASEVSGVFLPKFNALSAGDKDIVINYIYLIMLLSLYGRRWRGPGFDYPYESRTTNISCSPEPFVNPIGLRMLDIYNSSSGALRNALDSVFGVRYNYNPERPEFTVDTTPIYRRIEGILGVDREPVCIRMYTLSYTMGAAISYMRALNLTFPGLNIDRIQAMSLFDERDAGRELRADQREPERLTPIPDYTPLMSRGLPFWIALPLEAPEIVTNMDQVRAIMERFGRARREVGTMTTQIPARGVSYADARLAFLRDIPLLSTLDNDDLLRQDGYRLESNGRIKKPDGTNAPPGMIITSGWAVALDNRLGPIPGSLMAVTRLAISLDPITGAPLAPGIRATPSTGAPRPAGPTISLAPSTGAPLTTGPTISLAPSTGAPLAAGLGAGLGTGAPLPTGPSTGLATADPESMGRSRESMAGFLGQQGSLYRGGRPTTSIEPTRRVFMRNPYEEPPATAAPISRELSDWVEGGRLSRSPRSTAPISRELSDWVEIGSLLGSPRSAARSRGAPAPAGPTGRPPLTISEDAGESALLSESSPESSDEDELLYGSSSAESSPESSYVE